MSQKVEVLPIKMTLKMEKKQIKAKKA